jgi:fatty acid desaturase
MLSTPSSADAEGIARGALSPAGTEFSLAEARGIIRDLFAPNPTIYWADFLTTILVGHAAFAMVQGLSAWLPGKERLGACIGLQTAAFLLCCALYYRAAMFIHELVHLPQKEFRAFRIVWNLLCGIPFLMPSFTYYTHLDHHRRRSYGTQGDGEYLSLVRLSPWQLALYFLQGLFVPALAVVRFLLLTPLTWICPPLRRLIHQRASSLVMDPSYIRPLPTKETLRVIRLQELLCFLWCLALFGGALLVGRWPYPVLIQGYLVGVILVTMNALRTAAAHRWNTARREVTFIEQMLDSVNIDSNSLAAILLNPVGLRFHALHHLFPSLPYHNAHAAHRRLLAELPADSPYRRTVEDSIWSVLADVLRRARENYRRQHHEPSQEQLSYERQAAL